MFSPALSGECRVLYSFETAPAILFRETWRRRPPFPRIPRWRLPDTIDKQPSFGTDDRRRILSIFKDRKKKRKNEKKKRNLSPNGGGFGTGNRERRDSPSTTPDGCKKQGAGGIREDNGSDKPPGKNESTLVGKENGGSLENVSVERDGKTPHQKGNGQEMTEKHDQEEPQEKINGICLNIPQHSQPSPPPNHPPPGQTQQRQSHSSQSQSQVPSTPDPSRMSICDSRETSAIPKPQPTHDSPLSPQTSVIELLAPDALFITIPHNERPVPLPGQSLSSLAVPAARHFISIYYAHFGGMIPGAQIGNLMRYYTSKAQKSVSIGGAHSVVTGRKDIAAQIFNFAGSDFAVRGVVAQDTADGNGVHILVTGTARTVGGVVASFAHSLSLVLISSDEILGENHANNDGRRVDVCPALFEALQVGYPFQIHNDALALLGDAGPVTQTPIQPPVQMQQTPPPPPPPPPGLF